MLLLFVVVECVERIGNRAGLRLDFSGDGIARVPLVLRHIEGDADVTLLLLKRENILEVAFPVPATGLDAVIVTVEDLGQRGQGIAHHLPRQEFDEQHGVDGLTNHPATISLAGDEDIDSPDVGVGVPHEAGSRFQELLGGVELRNRDGRLGVLTDEDANDLDFGYALVQSVDGQLGVVHRFG